MSDEDSTYIPSNSEEESYEEDELEQNFSQGSIDNFAEGYTSEEEECVEHEDYNHIYTTNRQFETREKAYDWIRAVGKDYNMYFAIWKTLPYRIYVRCDRARKYRPTKTREGSKPRKSSGSKMILCPFQVIVEEVTWSRVWVIRTMPNRGRHNHSLGKNKEGHRWPSALKVEEFEIIRHRSELGVKPTKILAELQLPPRENYSNLQHIYNAKQKQRREQMGELPPFEFFFMLLDHEGWYHTQRPIPGTNQLGDIFFADRRSLVLLQQFPQVLLIDATYKTNRWNLPLVEIIGVVPTGQSFHIAFAFVHDEKESTYTWVMEQVQEILMDQEPGVILTDRELASMNAIARVFGNSKNLLCHRHIIVDVKKYLAKLVKSTEKEKTLSRCWKAIVNAQTVETYEFAVTDLQDRFRDYPRFVQYVFDTWLDKHKEKFVAVWVDKHLHYGQLTTNRVESAHAQLKGDLQSARGDFPNVWGEICRVVSRQLATIAEAFEESRSIVLHEARKGVFSRLSGKVSHKAILLMWKEIEFDWQRNPELCNHSLWTSHGLPCMCRIIRSSQDKVRIHENQIDEFWKTLYLDGSNNPSRDEQKANYEAELDEAYKAFKARACEFEMKKLTSRLRNGPKDEDEFHDYEEPPCPSLKGRPAKATGNRFKDFFENRWKKNKSNKTQEEEKVQKKKPTRPSRDGMLIEIPRHIFVLMPNEIRSFLAGYCNTIGDGHCGYRVISWWFFGGDEHEYVRVRLELKRELVENASFWWSYYGDEYPTVVERVEFIGKVQNSHYWMGAFLMLPLVATCYQKIIYFYAQEGSTTYLPLRSDYNEEDGQLIAPIPEAWHIGYANSHYFVLNVLPDAPKPHRHILWRRNAQSNVSRWSHMLGCSKEWWRSPPS